MNWTSFLLLLLSAPPLAAEAQPSVPQTQAASFLTENDVAVPMRDGVVLRADVLRPKGEGRFPILVYERHMEKSSRSRITRPSGTRSSVDTRWL